MADSSILSVCSRNHQNYHRNAKEPPRFSPRRGPPPESAMIIEPASKALQRRFARPIRTDLASSGRVSPPQQLFESESDTDLRLGFSSQDLSDSAQKTDSRSNMADPRPTRQKVSGNAGYSLRSVRSQSQLTGLQPIHQILIPIRVRPNSKTLTGR